MHTKFLVHTNIFKSCCIGQIIFNRLIGNDIYTFLELQVYYIIIQIVCCFFYLDVYSKLINLCYVWMFEYWI